MKLPDVMHNVMEIVMQTLGVDVAINVAGIYKKKNGDFFSNGTGAILTPVQISDRLSKTTVACSKFLRFT